MYSDPEDVRSLRAIAPCALTPGCKWRRDVGEHYHDAIAPVARSRVAEICLPDLGTDQIGHRQKNALSTTCTHLGCTPNWLEREQKFKCPCHGSGYFISGVNFEGPAPRPLERWALSVGDDGQLVVDKSRSFHAERGEWSNPDSFIKV